METRDGSMQHSLKSNQSNALGKKKQHAGNLKRVFEASFCGALMRRKNRVNVYH